MENEKIINCQEWMFIFEEFQLSWKTKAIKRDVPRWNPEHHSRLHTLNKLKYKLKRVKLLGG